MGIIRAKKPIVVEDLPAGATLDTEFDAKISAAFASHVTAQNPHPQYFRGILQIISVDLPNIGAGALHKIFASIPNAVLNDPVFVVPVSINLFTTAVWPFQFAGVVENNSAINNVGIYFHNAHSVAIDPATFQICIIVFKFPGL